MICCFWIFSIFALVYIGEVSVETYDMDRDIGVGAFLLGAEGACQRGVRPGDKNSRVGGLHIEQCDDFCPSL